MNRPYFIGLGMTAHLAHRLADAIAPYAAMVVALGRSGGTAQTAADLADSVHGHLDFERPSSA